MTQLISRNSRRWLPSSQFESVTCSGSSGALGRRARASWRQRIAERLADLDNDEPTCDPGRPGDDSTDGWHQRAAALLDDLEADEPDV